MPIFARMTEKEHEEVMQAAMKAAYTGETVNFAEIVKTEGFVITYGEDRLLMKVAGAVLILLLVLALLVGSVLNAEASAGPPVVEGCVEDFDHHNPATNPYFDRLFSGGTVFVHKALNSVIIFVKIRECGQRYLIGFWRNGTFTTAFLANWGYVQSYTAGFVKTVLSRVQVASIFFVVAPCPGTWTEFQRPCSGGGSNQ